MKRRTILIVFCSLFFAQFLNAQIGKKKIRVTASDSTVFNMDFVEFEGDDTYKNYIFMGLGGNDLGSILQLGYTRYESDKFIATGEIGALPTAEEINVGGIYFKLHDKIGCGLKYRFMTTGSDFETKYYTMKSNGIRNIHLGLHGQVGYRKQNLQYDLPIITGDTTYDMLSYSSGRIAGGVGLVATRNGLIHVGNNNIFTGAGSMFTVFADLIYYPGQRITYTKTVYNGTMQQLEPTGLGPKDVTNGNLGFEVRIIGQHQFRFQKAKIPHAYFGFRWQAGLVRLNYTGPNAIPTFGKFATTFTVGLYVGFGQ